MFIESLVYAAYLSLHHKCSRNNHIAKYLLSCSRLHKLCKSLSTLTMNEMDTIEEMNKNYMNDLCF